MAVMAAVRRNLRMAGPMTRMLGGKRVREEGGSLRNVAARAAGVDVGEGESLKGTWLLVGLGNPGGLYEKTRHNVGFEVVDAFASRHGFRVEKSEHKALTGRCTVAGQRLMCMKPQTFMNCSGESVGPLMKYYKIRREHLIVVYDDLDTEVGKVRLRASGGHGGHNGMRSIIERLGGRKDFCRVRVGIGRPTGSMPVSAFVLQKFKKDDRFDVDCSIVDAIELITSVLTDGVAKAVSQQPPTK